MRCALRWASLVLTLALVLPLWAQDYGTGKKYEKPDTKDPKDKLRTGKLTGTLAAVDSNLKTLTLEVTWVARVENPDVKRTILDLREKLNKTSDFNTRLAIRREIDKNLPSLYSDKVKKQKFDFQAVDEANVRWKTPPPAFDDKGNPKKYTRKELDELRGPDKKLPGYTAEFADLRPTMTVEVHVAKPKAAKPAKGKEKDDDPPPDKKQQVTMIIIVATPPK